MVNKKILEKPTKLVVHVSKFLKKKSIYEKKVCLGYSGGIDSTALLHILRKCQRFVNFTISLAHVNHGWRKEADLEADQIRNLSQENGIELYLYRVPENDWKNNIEDRYRKERLHFFQTLYRENAFDILILAHHAQDVAETVLKRVLEGASLYKIAGLKEDIAYCGMPIYRPLLSLYKKDLIQYVGDHNLRYFEDRTNLDQKYLRNRMKHTLFPVLEKCFQKKISKNLSKLSERCHTLEGYLQKNTRKFYPMVRQQAAITIVDLSPFSHLEKIEIDFFLRCLLESLGGSFSSSQIATVVTCLIENKYNKITKTKDFALRIHGKILYIEPIRYNY